MLGRRLKFSDISVLETVFKRSKSGILAGNSFRGSNSRWGAVVREGFEFPRSVRIVSRRKARKALAVRLGVLGKGGGFGTPRGVTVKGEGISRRPDNTSEGLGTIGVWGAFQAIALGATRSGG